VANNKQIMEKYPQMGRDKAKRFTPSTLPGKPGNVQRPMKQGVDTSYPDQSKRFRPPPP
jgi:hypothetical protein